MPLPQYEAKATPQVDPITLEKEALYHFLKDIPLRIGIHAGKGGVGKTFLATQLAMILAKQGKSVGLIDADVDCPNVPYALAMSGDMNMSPTGKLVPRLHNGVQVVSSGLMQEEGQPLIIRGPIKHRLLTDFIEKTEWKTLDALIFDFPPGTSDVPLSAMQIASLTGVIIVTTPQTSSVNDARRAANMAKKLGVHVYGIVENMCGKVFGEGSGKKLSKELDLLFVASIPLSKEIREQAEMGKSR